jgi:hypothetical protein
VKVRSQTFNNREDCAFVIKEAEVLEGLQSQVSVLRMEQTLPLCK